MANESQVLSVSTGGASGRLPTGSVALVDASGVAVHGAASTLVAGTTRIFQGACTTRDTVRAEVGTCAIGSLYVSTAGKLYLKVANAAATTDWQKVTATAAD